MGISCFKKIQLLRQDFEKVRNKTKKKNKHKRGLIQYNHCYYERGKKIQSKTLIKYATDISQKNFSMTNMYLFL